MYKQNKMKRTSVKTKMHEYGKTIEQKVELMVNNGEPLDGGDNELIYTEKADGVLPAYNPRADRFDIAIETVDKINKSNIAKKANKEKKAKEAEKAKMEVIKNESTDVNKTNTTNDIQRGNE